MERQEIPLNCGKRLLPVVIDQIAAESPSRPWASVPKDDKDLSQGYEAISYDAFANAINKVAWFLESRFGRSSTFETIFYFGAPDIRYHVVQMAVCKTGHTVLFSSHLNSVEVHRSLIAQTQCKMILSATGVAVDDFLQQEAGSEPMPHVIIPELDDLLDLNDRVKVMPYTKTYEEAKNDPYLILHSSGTTGLPKPLVSKLALTAAVDAQSLLPDVEGQKRLLEFPKPSEGVRYLVPTPPYYSMSALLAMVISVFGGAIFVPGYRYRAVALPDIGDVLKHARVTSALMTPWHMDEIARLHDSKDYIAPLEHVFVGGAAVSAETSKIWAESCRVHNVWGATELITVPMFHGDPTDQAYITFDIESAGIEFRDTATEDFGHDGGSVKLYKMVFVLTPKSAPFATWYANLGISLDSHQPPYPELSLGDLWTPHPDPRKSKYAWKFVGRDDDLITFSSGVKANPAPLERALNADPRVASAIMIGDGHLQAVVLVELASDKDEDIDGVSQVASDLYVGVIEPVNAKTQKHSCITRTHIVVVSQGQFVRTTKGSVARKQTQRKFQDDINSIYENYGDAWQGGKGSD